MNTSLASTLVLCDFDNLLLDADGNLPQMLRDVIQLYRSRGGQLTIFSQRSPRAVRTLLGGVRLAAPALVCGGALAYSFSAGSGLALTSFAGQEDVLRRLPSAVGLGIALQMRDGSTRVLRMSEVLEGHLRAEWTPFILSNAEDVRGEDVLRVLLYQDKKQLPVNSLLEKTLGASAAALYSERIAPDTIVLTAGNVSGEHMLHAVCEGGQRSPKDVTVLADCSQMLELLSAAGQGIVPADAAAELRLAASHITLTDHNSGAAAEVLYDLTRRAEAAT